MFKLTVTNPQNAVLHSATYPTLEDAEFWKQEMLEKNEWNFPTRTEIVPERTEVIPAVPERIEIIPEIKEVLDLDGVTVLVPGAPEQTIVYPEIPEQTIVYPSYEKQVPDVTITIEDITVQTAYENEIQKRVKRIDFSKYLFAELATRNVARLKAGKAKIEDIVSAEKKLNEVQRLLANSSLEIALQTLTALDIKELPAEEKQYFIGKIQEYLKNG